MFWNAFLIRLGNLHLDHPFTLAALSGYSDLPMRRLSRRHGASYAVAEVMLDTSVIHRSRWQQQILSVQNDDHPLAAQVMGANPESVAAATARLVCGGYDAIDINFGCPARKILRRGHGGALLQYPDTALAVVRSVLDAVDGSVPVTVKLRRGFDASTQSRANFFAILDGVLALNIAGVTLHARTVEQAYAGTSDWHFLKQVKEYAGSATVIGSGDLFAAEDCIRMLETTGVDAVAIARGALGNPWIFRSCLALVSGEPLPPVPALFEQRAVIVDHLEETIAIHGVEKAVQVMRKIAMRYAALHPQRKQLREELNSVKSTDDLVRLLDRWYQVP